MPKYIEYEALKKKVNDAQAEKAKFPFNGSLYETGYHNGLTMALTLAMQSPDADVAPVRHGRWEFPIFSDKVGYELDPRCKCSECGSVEMPLARHKFCPNCGARMDGDAEP